MEIKFVGESHTDHGLKAEHWAFIVQLAKEHQGPVMIGTFQLPTDLEPVMNGLHGPACGDQPIEETEVSYAQRGDRPWTDRMCHRPPRETWELSIVAIDVDGSGVLTMFTAYGGPLAPQHPDDPSNRDPEGARLFWAQHALSL